MENGERQPEATELTAPQPHGDLSPVISERLSGIVKCGLWKTGKKQLHKRDNCFAASRRAEVVGR